MSATPGGLQERPETTKRRVRELYKYFIPPTKPSGDEQAPAPDTVLGAFAQLVAHRMKSRRAMISLIGSDTQYFIAESSKTIALADSSIFDDPQDAIWAGCISVPKAGRLCEQTIAASAPISGGHAYFEVLDLQADSRFNSLPFVVGDPHYRYYCGVPLKSRNGVPIGSIFALDDAVREPIPARLLAFMVTMSENCMLHLESLKEKENLKRYKVMSMCLTAFVDPDNMTRRKRKSRKSVSSSSSLASVRRSTAGGTTGIAAKLSTPPEKSPLRAEVKDSSSQHSSDVTAETKVEKVDDDDYSQLFKIAASLMSKSLDLESPSGVVFLDIGSALNKVSRLSAEESSSEDEQQQKAQPSHASTTGATQISYKSWTGSLTQTEHYGSVGPKSNPSEVLATSSDLPAFTGSPESEKFKFNACSQKQLSQLIKKYPRGMMFNLEDQELIVSSSSEEREDPYVMPTQITKATKTETGELRNSFPNARQVIFVPVWNPSFSRFSAFFAVNRSPFRTFSNSPDFLHAIAFCHCLTTELTRIITVAADQQKTDFIGSISHELRSPLHGILASCEFLDDTELSSFQKSLIDTADSCARTLLDTINMVLDYSKINAFERNMTKAKRGGKRQRLISPTPQLQPALNIYGEVDLAAITEEVVEGVATGQTFLNRLASVDVTDLGQKSVEQSPEKSSLPAVEVILDIPPGNWMFLTQPGAFRRVVMNIFGNSQKYCSRGHIIVKLESQLESRMTDESEEVHIITLTITDTGQGISPKYMKTRLFTPFAQESTISPGTGLGLSLVRSIVRMLNGEIDIKSTLGVGTEVVMKFPMTTSPSSSDKQSLPSSSSKSSSRPSGSTPSTGPSTAGSIERTRDDSLHLVRNRAKGRSALYYSAKIESASRSDTSALLQDIVSRYLTDWYNLDMRVSLDIDDPPHVIIVRQTDLLSLRRDFRGMRHGSDGPMIVVITSNASSNFATPGFDKDRVETISYPFGPYKLAKIIRICLDNLDRASVAETNVPGTSTPPSTERDEELPEVVQTIDELTIGGDVQVVQQGQIMANKEFASLMVDALSAQSTRSLEQSSEFPFPSVAESAETPRGAIAPQATQKILERSIASPIGQERLPRPSAIGHPLAPVRTPREPRLLLVDDNKVNLRLLNTFMQKRGYTDVHMAEDGINSVEVYKSLIAADPPQPPDIIFMDISMPVMNGFEATRRIRELEMSFRDSLPPMQTPPMCMIIALTGLASSRDQSEAFTSGFDLYLVKPISFKSVAKLLDSWERNGGAATLNVPHGSLSEENIQPP